MATNLVPISSDGGFITAGNITTASYASPAPTLSGFSTVSADNFRLMSGNITGGIATVVDDGINSIALALGAQMDVFGFPFSAGGVRGQLTISDVTTPSEVNGTWYYQSINTNTYQIYTNSTYSTLVDATGWSAYTGGGNVAITKQVPAANIVINTNGYLTKFDNTGQVNFPNNIVVAGNVTGAYILGNGSQLTNLPAPAVAQDITSAGAMSIMTYDGNLKYVSYATVEPSSGNIAAGNISTTGIVTATGNITGGNLSTGGLITSTGNITGGNLLTGGLISSTGNITGGNLLTGGLISSTGNITGGNLIGPLANGTSNVTIATAAGNVVTNVNGSTVLTAYSGGIKVGGSGILQSPGGAGSITLNNNGANIPTANITTQLNVTGASGANITANLTAGNISTAGNITGNTNGFAIGYLNIPQVAASNTTIALTDAGKHYYSTSAGDFTLTIPNNATTSFATGTAISIVVQSAGNVLVNAASSVTLYMAGNSTAANRVVSNYGMATLMKVATDTWMINGTGVA